MDKMVNELYKEPQIGGRRSQIAEALDMLGQEIQQLEHSLGKLESLIPPDPPAGNGQGKDIPPSLAPLADQLMNFGHRVANVNRFLASLEI